MNWRDKLSLSTQFLVAAGLVLCVSMAVLGTWVNHQITRSVLVTSGEGGFDFMMGFLQSEVQDLLPDGTMPLENQQRLDQLFVGTKLADSIVSVKIWRPDGVVIYSSMAKDVIGQHFVSTDVDKAASGRIVAEFEDMVSAESAYEQTLKKSLIEVYAPLFREGTDVVVAVGEIYEDADVLDTQLEASRLLTWVVVCVTTLLMIAFLYAIVRRGSYTIAKQRGELNTRIAEAQDMATQNEQLRLDANEANEELLGRIGSDIHDGPIQVLTLARFRLDEIAGLFTEKEGGDGAVKTYLDEARNTLSDSIDELRHLSTGLVLPELDELSPREVIELARDRHASATATQVDLELDDLPPSLSEAMKICIYRIVQESLTNAFRHAGGIGQKIEARVQNNRLELSISDQGARMAKQAMSQTQHSRLGHRGIRNRVQAFGGILNIDKSATGTTVRVSLPIDRIGLHAPRGVSRQGASSTRAVLLHDNDSN